MILTHAQVDLDLTEPGSHRAGAAAASQHPVLRFRATGEGAQVAGELQSTSANSTPHDSFGDLTWDRKLAKGLWCGVNTRLGVCRQSWWRWR
jgi:hypothetical protein